VFSYFLKVKPPVGHNGLKNFAFFLLCGLLPWNFLSNGMTGSMGALVGNANLIKKVYFPREILVAASVVSWDVSLVIEMSVLAVAFLFVGNFVLPWLPLVVLMIVLLTAFVLGVSLALSVLNVYFRDVQHFVAILLQLWFYATPIVYPLSVVPAKREILGVSLRTIYELNPMVRFVEVFRDLLYDLRFPPVGDVIYLVVVSSVTLAAGMAIFWRLEPRLAEEL
jgi:ABC-2 type transport system permease protein